MAPTWLLLVYTVPAAPSRKRAAVWRAVKSAGAVYLRDGVAALPERPASRQALAAVAALVERLGGQATLVEGARLDPQRAAALAEEARQARAAEYADLAGEAERFLAHLRAEVAHRELGAVDRAALAADLAKLERWAAQVRARDYLAAPGAAQVEALLARCRAALGEHVVGRVEAAS
ncbi:MAG: hypothetical protein HY691_09875 [Chloroflexi bacterium]|nr:hypothetical protein [Chloroflexota bacterium]